MNKRRLLKLAALLEADAKNPNGIKFNLNTWGRTKTPNNPISCGTTACAMGLAAVSGAFKRHGLSYHLAGKDLIITHSNIPPSGWWFSATDPIDVAEKLFEVTHFEANWLFIPNYYGSLRKTGAAGEIVVAQRIRDFVAGKARP